MIISTKRALRGALLGGLTALASIALWAGDSAAAAACPTLRYHSNPALRAQRACMSSSVQTHGTQPGTDLFMTPNGANGAGAGIFQDNGDLVWWHSTGGVKDHDLTVVHYQGQPYLALWSGGGAPDGSYGIGSVTLYNQHYQYAGRITAPRGYGAHGIDLHEFQITRQGDALIGSYTPFRMRVNGHVETVLGYLVEKLSLVHDSSGIHTGKLLFAWNAINDVRLSDSHVPDPGANGIWDYFHGNGITQDTDGDLLVSARNTWGIYKINDRRGTPGFDHVYWQVGAKHDNRLAEPWCYQHDVAALGNGEYSVYDDGGTGPGCMPGSSQHPARGVIFSVRPIRRPVPVRTIRTYAHSPRIYTGFTGSTQVLGNGDVLIDWANVPKVTEYAANGRDVKMELSLSNWSYRGFRFAWDGKPLTPPSAAARNAGSGTNVWASWNGATAVAAWQVLGGPSPSQLVPVGTRKPKTGFETGMFVSGHYATIEVQAVNAGGRVLGTSRPVNPSG